VRFVAVSVPVRSVVVPRSETMPPPTRLVLPPTLTVVPSRDVIVPSVLVHAPEVCERDVFTPPPPWLMLTPNEDDDDRLVSCRLSTERFPPAVTAVVCPPTVAPRTVMSRPASTVSAPPAVTLAPVYVVDADCERDCE
jgi:hypothetical protein